MDNKGATALHLAAKKSGREMCRKLLAAGATPDLTDADGQTALEAAARSGRDFNEKYLRFYGRLPRPLARFVVARGEHGRSFYNVPTSQGVAAIVFILVAYLYYAAVLLPATWGRLSGAHATLLVCTLPMYFAYYQSWRGDPGIIPPQPDFVLQALESEEMRLDEILITAMSPKLPRAKYSAVSRVYLSIMYLSIYIYISISISLSLNLSIDLSRSICRSIYRSIYSSIHLSIYLLYIYIYIYI